MRKPHVTLAWKMTALFALFGVLISYVGFIMIGTQASAALVKNATSLLHHMASTLLPDRSSASIAELTAGRSLALSGALGSSLDGASPLETDVFSLFLRPATGGQAWSRALVDKEGRLSLLPLDTQETRRIDALVDPAKGHRLPPFWGQKDHISFLVDLSRPGDAWLLVAQLSLSRDFAISTLRQEGPLAIIGLVLWLALALGLSQFFGRRLARPVRELAAWSLDSRKVIAFRDLTRGDELGSLARSLILMRNEIEDEKRELGDRARALESMNRIDRAVLAGEARPILLGKVLDAVLDYNPAELAAIVVRDPDGGGYVNLASAGPSVVSGRPGGLIPDDEIPASLLIRFSDPFEVPFSELGGAGAYLLPGQPMTDISKLRFANLPFAAAGGEGGSLILVREGGADLARLGLLADQAGVALKDLDQRAASERNWLAVVTSLVRAVDAKSAWTKGHSDRVAILSMALGRRLLMEGQELTKLEYAAVLHDVGKIGVPETILDKPGRLTDEEMTLVKRHPVIGAGIIADIPSFSEVRPAILYHHERWDGSGYPEGLAGEAIPLGARIIALADVYDAITDERPYRHGMAPAEARDFITAGAWKLFDPRLVRIFLELLDEGLPADYRP